MFDWFKKLFVGYEKIISSNNTDNFADTLLVELKASSTSAITNAVNKIEGKYMKSVLENLTFRYSPLHLFQMTLRLLVLSKSSLGYMKI